MTHLTPRLVSVEVGGEGLAGFRIDAPTSHIKVFFPPPDQSTIKLPVPGPDGVAVWPEDVPRPVMRTYTPRRFHPETNTLEIQFVLHGPGPASTWAEQAKAGDQVAIGGPGGRFQLDPAAQRWWIAGDESAIPAVATLLESLSPTATADVHLEVDGPEDELPLDGPAQTTITWHHRAASPAQAGPDAWGAELYAAAEKAGTTEGTSYWVACEAAVVRRIRKHFLAQGVPATALTSRGYWRLGEANHPDHDYGDDA